MSVSQLLGRLRLALRRLLSAVLYRPTFAHFGRRSWIRRPIMLSGRRWISVGDRCSIRDGARIEVFHRAGEAAPSLRIGDGVTIEQGAHIVCSSSIVIEDDVAIAPRASIVDTTHPLPTERASNVGAAHTPGAHAVVIGAGTMLGVGAVVLPDVRIGKGCVVGANAVVTSDVPDYSVVAGSPARVIRSLRQPGEAT